MPSTKREHDPALGRRGVVLLGRFQGQHDVMLEAISTAVLMAPRYSTRWTSCVLGHAAAPKRSTMYAPISPAKNMISVDRNSHRNSLPLGIGSAGWYSRPDVVAVGGRRDRTSCVSGDADCGFMMFWICWSLNLRV